MAEIQVISPQVANMIAAGEVVERAPANQKFAGDPTKIKILGGNEFRLRKFSACGCELAPDSRRPAAPPREASHG